jgi:hypothetical protein
MTSNIENLSVQSFLFVGFFIFFPFFIFSAVVMWLHWLAVFPLVYGSNSHGLSVVRQSDSVFKSVVGAFPATPSYGWIFNSYTGDSTCHDNQVVLTTLMDTCLGTGGNESLIYTCSKQNDLLAVATFYSSSCYRSRSNYDILL